MGDFLFRRIADKVYKTERIQEVSLSGNGTLMPWIFDFKNQALSKDFLEAYAEYFWSQLGKEDNGIYQIGGMEAGALPLIAGVTLLAPKKSSVTSFYIRKSRKKSDQANLIEGELKKDVPIILIDDIINSGDTFKKQIMILEDAGYRVQAIFVCLRYRDLSAYKDITDKGVQVFCIFELNDFNSVLPVKNMTDTQLVEHKPIWKSEYKVVLTKKPNLYMVVPKSAPCLYEGLLYVGVDDGSFFCLNAETGATKWTHKVFFGAKGKKIFSSPQVYKDCVIFGAYDGNVYCLDRLTGALRWVFTDADWVGSSPCINEFDGVVYIGLEFGLFKKQGGLVAIDIKTGEALWKNYGIEGYVHATPAYNKKYNIVVCGSNDKHLYACNARTGEIQWKYKTQGEIKYSATFSDDGELVVFGGLEPSLYVLHTRNGGLYHSFQTNYGFYSTPSIVGDLILAGSLDKNMYCFDIGTRKMKWVYETSGRIFASPLVHMGKVFIGSNDGRLYELDIATGKRVSYVQLTERIVNKIQIEIKNDGRRVLYIVTHVGELYKVIENKSTE